jgi:hypothetical protein
MVLVAGWQTVPQPPRPRLLPVRRLPSAVPTRLRRTGGSGPSSGHGNWSCWLTGVVRERGFDMGILLALVCQGRYHREEGAYPCDGQSTEGQRWGRPSTGGGGNRNDAFDAGVEPYDTDASQVLFGGDADQWQGKIIQRMGGVRHRHGVGRQCSDLERGILMGSCSPSQCSAIGAGRRPAPPVRGCLPCQPGVHSVP